MDRRVDLMLFGAARMPKTVEGNFEEAMGKFRKNGQRDLASEEVSSG